MSIDPLEQVDEAERIRAAIRCSYKVTDLDGTGYDQDYDIERAVVVIQQLIDKERRLGYERGMIEALLDARHAFMYKTGSQVDKWLTDRLALLSEEKTHDN